MNKLKFMKLLLLMGLCRQSLRTGSEFFTILLVAAECKSGANGSNQQRLAGDRKYSCAVGKPGQSL